ncbi:MAG: hypothetical protein IJW30_03010 [Clostridia bacterium]|nr:hypothetical protein [Clostridia bacterium]
MNKSTVTKWIVASVGFAAVAAFTAGVIYQLRAIKKLSVNIDEEEENEAEATAVEEGAEEAAEAVEEGAEEATEAPAEA